MFYIFNKKNKCICSCDYEPNIDDLNTRNEFCIESDKTYNSISTLVYENGKIIEKELPKETISTTKENKPSMSDEIEMLKKRIQELENTIS